MKVLYMTLYHKFFIDEIYLFITKHIIFPLIGRPAAWIDKFVIDGTVIAIGRTTDRIAETVRVLQTGRVQDYALFFIASFITLALFAIYFFH